jgi:hypothetical protein
MSYSTDLHIRHRDIIEFFIFKSPLVLTKILTFWIDLLPKFFKLKIIVYIFTWHVNVGEYVCPTDENTNKIGRLPLHHYRDFYIFPWKYIRKTSQIQISKF